MGLGAGALPSLSPSSTRAAARGAQGQLERQIVGSRAVVAIPAKDAAAAMRHRGGYRLLDVRPPWERERAWLRGSLHVPVYVEDDQMDPLTLLKKWIHFGYIGLWTGQRFTALNPRFLREVESLVPAKDDKLLVACGEGLRSAVALRKLAEDGYENLALLAGGFSRAGEEDFDGVEGSTKLRYATVGGVSYYFLQLLLLLKVVS
ncbi:Rhodanese-like domain-containing protein 10 [Platanthera zijinensis]|uniref:Rhodanese-like domain-containing protein 10 n=1 Tax=Platanthera zijinensis TaxID=2320716 RepID=A0AAP0ARX6_9ASPA